MNISDIKTFVLNHHRLKEKQFSKLFPEIYKELDIFPKDFSFRQKLYHHINNDTELKSGVCPVCGKRCSFESLNAGYKHHCSKRCSTLDPVVKEKRQNTCLQIYGYTHESKSPIIKNKKVITCRKNLGVDYPMQSDVVMEKMKNSNNKNFGYDYTFQSPHIQNKIQKTVMREYDVLYMCMHKRSRNGTNHSKPNRDFEKLLMENNIEYEREFVIEKYVYDFKIDYILVEINPSVSHCSNSKTIYKSKDRYYHYLKTQAAEKYNYVCICVWDWTNVNDVIKLLKTHKFNLYKCSVQRHLYNTKTKNHIIDDYIPADGFYEIFDDGQSFILI